MDLWETTREGTNKNLVLPCGPDWCTGAAAAPGSEKFAYSRRTYSGLPGSQPGLGQIWIFDRISGTTDLLFANPNIAGEAAAWSPDGRLLAFFDPRSQQIGVVDFFGSLEFFIPAGEGAGFAWSPDSSRLAVTRPETTGEAPYTVISMVDVETQQAIVWIGEDALDFGVPAWAPDGRWLLAPVRLVGGVAGRGLWLMPVDDPSNRQVVTQDALANDSSPQWHPAGALVAFQRLILGASGSRPAVMAWDKTTGAVQTLAEDAFQPRWIGN
jgi:Tol biopolymer transport system component